MGKHKDRRRGNSSSDEEFRDYIKELKQWRKKQKQRRRISSQRSRSRSPIRNSRNRSRSRRESRSTRSTTPTPQVVDKPHRTRTARNSSSPVGQRRGLSSEHQSSHSPHGSTREPRSPEIRENIPGKHFIIFLRDGAWSEAA